MRLVIATHNIAKAREMSVILQELLPDWTFLSLADFPSAPEPDETGSTYVENATIKAEASAGLTHELCIADDAGLEVDAMDGAPGIKSKRFEGVDSPFDAKIEKILSMLIDQPELPRTARFRCCVAVAAPGQATRVFEAAKEGVIADSPCGANGFGYDPIFLLPELGKTYAELEPDHKNRISHRGLVLRQAAECLATM